MVPIRAFHSLWSLRPSGSLNSPLSQIGGLIRVPVPVPGFPLSFNLWFLRPFFI